jgi:hypothetical protein
MQQRQVGCATFLDSKLSQGSPADSMVEPQQAPPERQPEGKAKRKLALHVAYCGTGYAGESSLGGFS